MCLTNRFRDITVTSQTLVKYREDWRRVTLHRGDTMRLRANAFAVPTLSNACQPRTFSELRVPAGRAPDNPGLRI